MPTSSPFTVGDMWGGDPGLGSLEHQALCVSRYPALPSKTGPTQDIFSSYKIIICRVRVDLIGHEAMPQFMSRCQVNAWVF